MPYQRVPISAVVCLDLKKELGRLFKLRASRETLPSDQPTSKYQEKNRDVSNGRDPPVVNKIS